MLRIANKNANTIIPTDLYQLYVNMSSKNVILDMHEIKLKI